MGMQAPQFWEWPSFTDPKGPRGWNHWKVAGSELNVVSCPAGNPLRCPSGRPPLLNLLAWHGGHPPGPTYPLGIGHCPVPGWISDHSWPPRASVWVLQTRAARLLPAGPWGGKEARVTPQEELRVSRPGQIRGGAGREREEGGCPAGPQGGLPKSERIPQPSPEGE